MLPGKIKGLPTDVIETGRFRAFAGAAKERVRIRPARPGCSVGFAFSGKDAEDARVKLAHLYPSF
jgi:hypothetical protein